MAIYVTLGKTFFGIHLFRQHGFQEFNESVSVTMHITVTRHLRTVTQEKMDYSASWLEGTLSLRGKA